MRTTNRKSEAENRTPFDPHISRRKFDTLVGRLEICKKKKPALAKEVAELATLGDFSENFEYQQAKRELRRNHNQVLKLQFRIDSAIIIEDPKSDMIEIGSSFTVEVGGAQKSYTIMGSSEINPGKGIISHTSPLGKAFLFKKVGDVVEVELPKGITTYTVKKIA